MSHPRSSPTAGDQCRIRSDPGKANPESVDSGLISYPPTSDGVVAIRIVVVTIGNPIDIWIMLVRI
jgi:hypothetical protein